MPPYSWTLHGGHPWPSPKDEVQEKRALGCPVPPGSPTPWSPVMPRKRRRVSPPEVVSGLRSRMGVGGCSCGKLAEAAGSSRESGKNDIKPGKMQAGWRAGCEGGRRGRQLPGLRTQREGPQEFPSKPREPWASAVLPSVLAPQLVRVYDIPGREPSPPETLLATWSSPCLVGRYTREQLNVTGKSSHQGRPLNSPMGKVKPERGQAFHPAPQNGKEAREGCVDSLKPGVYI